jgi:hypothetical protein
MKRQSKNHIFNPAKNKIMKYTIKDNTPPPPYEYPMLMIDNDKEMIVLMTVDGVGTVITHYKDKAPWPVGHHATTWSMECFKPFNGEVTLAND